jgi:hypothetical protein
MKTGSKSAPGATNPTAGGLQLHARAIGRHQRMVHWAAMENVLFINWERVRSDLRSNKGGHP